MLATGGSPWYRCKKNPSPRRAATHSSDVSPPAGAFYLLSPVPTGFRPWLTYATRCAGSHSLKPLINALKSVQLSKNSPKLIFFQHRRTV